MAQVDATYLFEHPHGVAGQMPGCHVTDVWLDSTVVALALPQSVV